MGLLKQSKKKINVKAVIQTMKHTAVLNLDQVAWVRLHRILGACVLADDYIMSGRGTLAEQMKFLTAHNKK